MKPRRNPAVRCSAWLGGWWKRLTRPKPKRLELRILSYGDADKLIRETNGAWTIAKEEDTNRCIGLVYLERLEVMVTNPPNDPSSATRPAETHK